MRTTRQLSITLPNDMADVLRDKVSAGDYAVDVVVELPILEPRPSSRLENGGGLCPTAAPTQAGSSAAVSSRSSTPVNQAGPRSRTIHQASKRRWNGGAANVVIRDARSVTHANASVHTCGMQTCDSIPVAVTAIAPPASRFLLRTQTSTSPCRA